MRPKWVPGTSSVAELWVMGLGLWNMGYVPWDWMAPGGDDGQTTVFGKRKRQRAKATGRGSGVSEPSFWSFFDARSRFRSGSGEMLENDDPLNG